MIRKPYAYMIYTSCVCDDHKKILLICHVHVRRRIQVTNQVFRYAKKAGASYINKPKMRHYVHCYALHCVDEEASNALRRAFKERGENVGAWRQACYKPLVDIAARQGWDIDAIFNAHPRLSIWYVPTKLRQLCHAERNNAAASSSVSVSGGGGGGGDDHMPFYIKHTASAD